MKSVPKSYITKVRNFPDDSGLAYEKYGKSNNIRNYTDLEILEMINGIYRDSKTLLADGNYFLELSAVVASKCILEKVTYLKKPTEEDYRTNNHNHISNIRTFYISDYFLITNSTVNRNTQHRITDYLYRIGFLNKGRKDFAGLYSISNCYKTIHNGKYPKDLFHPIKRYVNGLFFKDDYRISDFTVESNLIIHS